MYFCSLFARIQPILSKIPLGTLQPTGNPLWGGNIQLIAKSCHRMVFFQGFSPFHAVCVAPAGTFWGDLVLKSKLYEHLYLWAGLLQILRASTILLKQKAAGVLLALIQELFVSFFFQV